MSWPGFSYEEREWSRLAVLASVVDGAEGVWFVTVNAIVFIGIASITMFALIFVGFQMLGPQFEPLSPLTVELLLAAAIQNRARSFRSRAGESGLA